MINLLKFTDTGSFVEWNTMETDRLNEKSDTDDLVKRLGMVDATMNPMTLVIVAREAASRIEQLTSGPGGIMEMKQTIANKEAEIERLQKDLEFYLPSV